MHSLLRKERHLWVLALRSSQVNLLYGKRGKGSKRWW